MTVSSRAAAILAAGVVFPANAQEPRGDAVELEPILVESATRTETPIEELTRSVTVVQTGEVQTQKRIDRSLGEILANEVPGFSPSTEANSNFGQTLRGRPFLTLIDGVPQSTPLRDGRRSLNAIDAEAIERIEVVRGGTAVYGFGATGGLVNIITRRPEDGAFNVDASAGFDFSATHPDDSFGSTANLGLSGRSGRFDYVANGTFVGRGGRFDAEGDRIPADPVGVQGGLADSDTVNILGKLGFQLTPNQRLQATGSYYDFEQDSDFAGISFEGDPETGRKTPAVRGNFNPIDPQTENANVNLEYEHRDVWGSSLSAQLYFQDFEAVFGKFPDFPQTRIGSEKIGSRLTIETPVPFGPLPFDVIWGADYLHDETEQTSTDAPTTSPFLEQDAIAGFAQLEIPIGEQAVVTGGVRYEDIDVDVSDFTRDDGTFVPGGTLKFDEALFNARPIEELVSSVRQDQPKAGAFFWSVRSWTLIEWQPAALAVLGVHMAGLALPVDRVALSIREGDRFGFRLPPEPPECGPEPMLIALAGRRLRRWADALLPDLARIAPVKTLLAQRLLADRVLALLAHVTAARRDMPAEKVLAYADLWLAAMALPGASRLVPLTLRDGRRRLALDRRSCCLEYRAADGLCCASCPRLAPDERVRRAFGAEAMHAGTH